MFQIDEQELEKLIMRCLEQLDLAAKDKIDPDVAERNAALTLATQTRLALYIEAVDLRARQSKTEIERVVAEKYYLYKEQNNGKKITENGLEQLVMKDTDVLSAKSEHNKLESANKKWMFILNSLKESHIFFRSIKNLDRYM